MRAFFGLLMALFMTVHASAQDGNEPARLYMKDGQFISHVITVFVDQSIQRTQNPKLVLFAPRTPFTDQVTKFEDAVLMDMADRQVMTVQVGSQKLQKTGTVLLFSLERYSPTFYKPVWRVRPVLRWDATDSLKAGEVISEDSVYIANAPVVYGYAVLIVVILAGLFAWLSHQAKGNALALLCSRDGRLSLSRSQVAGWTMAIGGLVFAFGMKELQVPDIPESLIVLMGMSLGTTGISYAQGRKAKGEIAKGKAAGPDEAKAAAAEPAKPAPEPGPERSPKPTLLDLISLSEPAGGTSLSIARAQMVFWTVLMLIIFVGKSFLDGTLWQVPWEMVMLMGISQAGYLGPQFAKAEATA